MKAMTKKHSVSSTIECSLSTQSTAKILVKRKKYFTLFFCKPFALRDNVSPHIGQQPILEPGALHTPLIQLLRRQKQANFCVFSAVLVYMKGPGEPD